MKDKKLDLVKKIDKVLKTDKYFDNAKIAKKALDEQRKENALGYWIDQVVEKKTFPTPQDDLVTFLIGNIEFLVVLALIPILVFGFLRKFCCRPKAKVEKVD